nr:putative disease resistance protein RGA3 [Ipomoea batatas]
MADGLISGVVKELINILKHQAQELKRALGVEKEIANLSSKLEKIWVVLDDAEKRSFKENGIKLWIEDIKDFSYQVDDVLDEWRTRTLRQQIESPEKIKELDSTLDRIMKEKDQFKFDYASITHTSAASHSDQELMRVTTAFDVNASEIQGRKSDASALISKLVENSGEEEARNGNGNGPSVISIVGTGGIGKTTLALLVFGDEQIKSHFDERVWICVSDPFDQIKIAKAIVESTTKSSTDLSQLQLLLEKIQSTLSGKRFLLVMDDMWTEQYAKWEPLKNSLKGGLPGSRILVTSRSERIARIMGSVYLHQLDLISDSEAWLLLSRIAFSGRREEDCEELKDIGQKIAKSYNDLTPKMKQCFLYCAVFPKDYKIKVDELIRIWMAQGYVTMESKGRELFGGLAMRSFFQDLEKDDMDSNIIISCKMHDIVHDFAQFLTRNECYSIDEQEDKVGIINLRHLAWQKTSRNMDPASICDIGKLRSFFAKRHPFHTQLTPDLFNGLKSVRVLGLPVSELQKLPKKIGNLLHLRCERLSRLPEGIGNLLELRGTERLEMIPQGIAKLTQVCSLSEFKVGKSMSDVEGAKKAELRNKKHITNLLLDFSGGVDVGIDVMEALEPPPELQTLQLIGYGGIHFPSWITLSLHNLRSLEMDWCVNCSSLPPLGKLPSLETLYIKHMKELRYVGSEFLGVGGVAFPKLKRLVFFDCPEWEEWEDLKEEATIIIMPCIRELDIEECKSLKTVPHHLLSMVESLRIEDCSSLKVG